MRLPVRSRTAASARPGRAWALVVAIAALASVPLASAAARPAVPHAAAATPSRIVLGLQRVNGPVRAVVSDATWDVSGSVPRSTVGQHASIRVRLDGRLVAAATAPITRRGARGVFRTSFHIGGVGRLTVTASTVRPRLASAAVGLWLVAPTVYPGERSIAVRILQYELAALHYVVGEAGVDDAGTQLAVLAFRKMANMDRTTVADATVFGALAAGQGTFTVRFPAHGRHVEADLTHQVLALIGNAGSVESIYPMSSGKPSTPTTLGSFTVYSKTPGINSKGMVDSSYFNGGQAIHGYAEVPPYAASHGCLRVPVPAAPTIYAWVQLGTPVDVYDR